MSTTTQHTQTAYKDTPIGKIPTDWEVKKLGEITQTTAGGTPTTKKSEYWGGDIKWMSSGELNLKKVFDVEGRITEEGLKNSSTKLLPPKCVLIGLAGQGKTRGTVAMNMVELCTNQSVAAIFPSSKFNEDYLFYNLDSRYNELRQLSTGDGGRGGLNLKIINSLYIPLPPLSEQKRIAEVLSTWDKAIQLTEQLIRQKEQRKKWLMQNLLTGKMRLKGFSGEWKECKLGSLGDTYTGLTGKIKEDFGKGKPYIPYLNVFNNSRIDIKNLDYVKITEDDKQNKVKYGDIFFTVSSETPNEVGMASVILDEVDELYLNSFCFGFRLFDFNTLIPEFSSYLLRADTFRAKIYKLSQGATRFNLSKNNLMKLSITLPSKEEQTAIAEVLQTADKEIELLKAKAKQLKEQKKGLMQQLLTGKKRLNLNLQD